MSQSIKQKLQELINQYIDDFDLIKKVKRLAFEQSNLDLRINDSSSFENLFDNAIKSLDSKNNKVRFFQSNFTELDEVIGGFSLGEFVVLGGRPGINGTNLKLFIFPICSFFCMPWIASIRPFKYSVFSNHFLKF